MQSGRASSTIYIEYRGHIAPSFAASQKVTPAEPGGILRKLKIAQECLDGAPRFKSILIPFEYPKFRLSRSHRVSDLFDKDGVNRRGLRYSSCHAGNI